MIHELCSLAGTRGCDSGGQGPGRRRQHRPWHLQVSPTVTFVSASERVAINRLVHAGYLYGPRAVQLGASTKPCAALSRGIDELLGDYLEHLRAIEIQAFEHPGEVTVAHLHSRVRSFATVLSVVRTIIEASRPRTSSRNDLEFAAGARCTGVPVIRKRVTELLNRVLQVFYGQLLGFSWHLAYDFNEFMVSRRVETFANRMSTYESASHRLPCLPQPHPHPLFPWPRQPTLRRTRISSLKVQCHRCGARGNSTGPPSACQWYRLRTYDTHLLKGPLRGQGDDAAKTTGPAQRVRNQ